MVGGGNRHWLKLCESHKNLKSLTLCFLSILCIHWGIASYQPFIDTALILLCGGIIAIIIDNKGDLKLSFYKSRFLIISVAFAAISYKITLDIMKRLGKVGDYDNNQMMAFSEMPERVLLAVKMSFQSLFAYNVPFMPEFIAILFGVFVAILLILLVRSQLKISAKFSIIIVLFGAIVASQTHIALSKNISTGIVIDFYGVLFLRVVLVVLVFKLIAESKKAQTLWQNLIFVLSFVVVWACVIQSLNAQKIQKLSIDNAFHYINRVVDRIEQDKHFSYDKKYCGIMFGEPKAMKDFIGFTLFPHWEMQSVFANTMSKNVFEGCKVYSDTSQMREDSNPKEVKAFYNIISRLHKVGILDKLKPFPHKDSVVVFEDIIVFVASKGNLDEIRKKVKESQ